MHEGERLIMPYWPGRAAIPDLMDVELLECIDKLERYTDSISNHQAGIKKVRLRVLYEELDKRTATEKVLRVITCQSS